MPEASKSLQDKIRELSKTIYRAATDLAKCISCGTCVIYCPLKIRIFNSEGKAITIQTNETCGGCSVCFHRCPQGAIHLLPLSRKFSK
ncbi:MAG: 4Fe-4S dicluster domain-containing protein [Candidatus Lokiarchaeota archaeon]|jgi:Pyruvate/2-oxoacid:ferredoxin oxidoreductase delta subunit|nr:4Fe-4S dicluster domain-containing protein [Candidatus Lokiarchaeota archaeon]